MEREVSVLNGYPIKDKTARQGLANLETELEMAVTNLETAMGKVTLKQTYNPETEEMTISITGGV